MKIRLALSCLALLALTRCTGRAAPLDLEEGPSLDVLSPTEGLGEGGAPLTLLGHRFSPGAAVTVGGVACQSQKVVSDSKITCLAPASAVGGDAVVKVTNPDGQSAGSSFFYYPPGALLLLRGDSLEGEADGSDVATWSDDSPGGRSAVQTTPPFLPTLRLNALNGHPAVHFSGVYPDLGSNPFLKVPYPAATVFQFAALTDFTLAVIARSTITGYFHQIIANESYIDRTGFGIVVDGFDSAFMGYPFFHVRNSCCPAAVGTYSVHDGAWHRQLGYRSGDSLTLYVDGQLQGTLASGAGVSIAASQELFLGRDPNNGFPWGGDMAEVAIWAGALSSADRAALDAHWKSKYGL